jgi:hypothetical protein
MDTEAEKKERRAIRKFTGVGFPTTGGGLRSMATVALLVPADRLIEARALLFADYTEIAAWRTPEIWRKNFGEHRIALPGQSSDSWVLIGRPR